MGRRSLLSLLLLVLLVFGYGPRPSLARCTATNPTQVYEGEKEITTKHSESGEAVYVTSFSVRPSSGFQSVNLTATAEAEIDGSKQTVLFSHLITADKCFKNDKWMKVHMWADLGKDPTLGFRVGDCWKECRADLGTATTGKLTLRWLNVTTRGRSKWTNEVSGKRCIKQLGQGRPSNVPNCGSQILQPPSSSTQTTLQPPSSSTQTTLQPPSSSKPRTNVSQFRLVGASVVMASVVVVTGAMLVLIGVCLRKKKRNATGTDSSTQTTVRERTNEALNNQDEAVGSSVIVFSHTEGPAGGRTEKLLFKNVAEGEMEDGTQDYVYEIL
ncbi:uncharacterized protein LOC126981852 isoform X2 [Eriocheir sinensis]|uniref:uncharacterized protein LOC126981852 isoform X2 n=1 Tax=Eriocheir sinensis TaxID=95602 RepID=UPI0021CAC53E|nr:uncharacterized protein LOC126981852 isoform X2 [Eriocheir sinensis]